MTLVTRGSLGYSSHQKGVIQGHLVHRYASRRAPALCSMIMFRTVLSLDVSTQTVFLYYVRKIYLEGLFLMVCGVHVTHWLSCQTDEINTVLQSFIGFYMRAQVNSSTVANICWLTQTFQYQFCGFQVHFESNVVYNLKNTSDFWSKYPHYIMDYIINLGSMFFLVSLVWNLAYIDYSLCQIWSVYMQYLQCCDHSKKWLFLVVQQAEVLLNCFWWVYIWLSQIWILAIKDVTVFTLWCEVTKGLYIELFSIFLCIILNHCRMYQYFARISTGKTHPAMSNILV